MMTDSTTVATTHPPHPTRMKTPSTILRSLKSLSLFPFVSFFCTYFYSFIPPYVYRDLGNFNLVYLISNLLTKDPQVIDVWKIAMDENTDIEVFHSLRTLEQLASTNFEEILVNQNSNNNAAAPNGLFDNSLMGIDNYQVP